MAKIRSKNTKPEITLRKALFARGLRFRIHYKLPGKPDIVFVKNKLAVFINGCFWHGHNCKEGHVPKSNKDFWEEKICRNRDRDKENIKKIRKMGWRVITIWECEIEKSLDKSVDRIFKKL